MVELVTWNTRADGMVEVSTDGSLFTVPTLEGAAAERFERQVVRWIPLIEGEAASHGIDPAEPVGITWAESQGVAAARSGAGAVGLMQLMPATAGRTPDELLDPTVNVHEGCRYIAGVRARGVGIDLPALASSYNAGLGPHGRPWPNDGSRADLRTRWGFRAEPGYIDHVVQGANYYRLRKSTPAST